MAKQDNKSFFSEWLEKLQQESWQLELLISGLALFGIYESQDLLIELKMYVTGNSEGIARMSQIFFLGILEIGWKIFFINLLIHIILRGLWIGAIGLRYVSQDIDYDALNYSKYFTNLLQKRVGRYDDFIEKLEKICSVLFAYTFLLFLLFFSLGFFFFQIMLFTYITNNETTPQALSAAIFLALYVLIGLIVFIDFITLGLFKKIEERSINKIYSYIFTFYGWTTLTFLYRPLLYNFLDNRYTRRLFFFSIPYILIILISSKIFTNNNFVYFPPDSMAQKFGNTIDRMNYEDLRKEYMTEVDSRISKRRQNIPNIILNKYLNDEDYLKIFMKMDPTDYQLIQKNTAIDPYWKTGINFSLFSSTKNTDRFYKEGRDSLEARLDSLRVIRRKLRKDRRNTEDTLKINSYTATIDSISNFITSTREQFLQQGIAFEEKKQKQTLEAFLDLIELEVNAQDAKPRLDCYFFEHPNNNEKGIMCLYPMDSLALGKNELYYYKEIKGSARQKDRTIDIILPFYKVRSMN